MLVADLFHPLDRISVQRLLNGETSPWLAEVALRATGAV
jgi:hypothetical protein